MVDLPNESDKATRQIESSNIYDQVASFDSIANAQTDMICRYEEVVNDDSMDETQIDMIYQPDDKAIFYSIPVNQNDSFLSLFLLFFQTIIF